MDISIIGIGFAIGYSLFILYSRKSSWLNPKIIWFINILFFFVTIYGLYFSSLTQRKYLTFFCHLSVPLIYWIFDRLFKHISLKLNNRDFFLYLRHSDEIDYSLGGKNPHVDILDKTFSFLLLIIIVGTTLGFITVFK